MAPGFGNAACYLPKKLLRSTEFAHKPSGIGEDLVVFLCIWLMAVGLPFSRYLINMPLKRMFTHLKQLFNHAEGVQYAIKSFNKENYANISKQTNHKNLHQGVNLIPQP